MTDTQVKRSGCLTVFIIALIVLYVLSALGAFLAGPLVASLVPEYTAETANPLIGGILALLNIVFLVGVWKFKKWGFYGFVAVCIINIVISVVTTSSIFIPVISGLILPALLYVLIRPIWNYMT